MTAAMEWTPQQRETLRSVLRKAQATAEQRELLRVTGDEARALYRAAQAWADMMDMLDERYAVKGISNA